MRKLSMLIVAVAFMLTTATAGARTTTSTTTSSFQVMLVTNSVSTTVTDETYDQVVALQKKGYKVLRFFKANGLPKSTPGCIGLPVGTKFLNSGVSRSGGVFWFQDRSQKGERFCGLKRTKGGRSGRKGNCGNRVFIPGHGVKVHRKVVTKIILVRSFKVLVKHRHKVTKTTSHSETSESGSSTSTTTTSSCDTCTTCNTCQPTSCPQGSTFNQSSHQCEKDGTTTPPPPSDAPGPNPPPNGGPSDPGSNPCYDNNTGQPVAPVNGQCPPGSSGTPWTGPPSGSGGSSSSPQCVDEDTGQAVTPNSDGTCPVGSYHP